MEKQISLGFDRSEKVIFDEVEQVSAFYMREGWQIEDAIVAESFDKITLFFVRDIDLDRITD